MYNQATLAAVRMAARRRTAMTDVGKRFMEVDNAPGKVGVSASQTPRWL